MAATNVRSTRRSNSGIRQNSNLPLRWRARRTGSTYAALRPEGTLGRLVDKDPITYKRWSTDGIVHGPSGDNGQPVELDAIEVGAFDALLTVLGDEDSCTAWGQVRERLLRIEPTEALRVVWREPYEALLCANDAEVGRAATGNGKRFIKVIEVGSASIEARRRLQLRLGS